MSDPLSVAGSAVGIISLGLQVCGEIVSYCQAWRGFDEDIQRITEKADGLCMLLKGLREIIEYAQRNSHAEASDLESKTQSLQKAILRLKSATDRCASTGSITPNGFRHQLKKATYPFKKEGLREISTDLDSIQIPLKQLFTCKLQASFGVSRTDQSSATLSKISEIIKRQPVSRCRTLYVDLRLIAAFDIKTFQSSKITGQSLPFMAPSRLRQLCDQQSIQQAIEPCLHVTEQTNSLQSIRYPPSSYKMIHFAHVRIARLDLYGPRFASKSEPKSSKEYRYSMSLLGFIFQASVRFDRGAGGSSIAPLLHMQPLLSMESSVGCKILQRDEFLFYLDTGLDNYENSIDLIMRQLQEAFDRREASPFDIVWIHSEVSIFDIAFKLISTHMPKRDPIWFSHTSRLLNFLLDCGSWTQGKNSRVENVMSLSPNASFGKEGSLGLRLLELGYPFQLRDPQSLIEKRELRYLIIHHDDYVARMIILESESELRYMMESGLISPNYREGEWSLLGLSFGWPQGLQILLQAGADASDSSIRFVEDTPRGGTFESVKLMLEAGCYIGFYNIRDCQELKNGVRIQSLLIQEMATRIRKLWDFALIHLPLHELPNLITHETVTDKYFIFDVHVQETLAKLEAQGTEICPRIAIPRWCDIFGYPTCFSQEMFSAETLENFYLHGFRGLNGFDKSGLSPLQSSFDFLFATEKSDWKRKLYRSRWLVSRGALVHLTVPGTNASIAHHLGVGAAEILIQTVLQHLRWKPNNRFRIWKQALFQAGERWFLVPSITDQCRCPCSPRGCTTLSVVLRRILRKSKRRDFKAAFSGTDGRELIQFLIESSKMTPTAHEEFIRCLTFDALDLKHACCRIKIRSRLGSKLKSREEEEIEEIIDEQKLRLIDFEKLVIEFQAKLDELALPIIEFLEGYWYNRMVEYLRQRDRYDEKHFIGSKSIGVNLIQDEEFSPSGMLSLIGSFNRVVDDEMPSMIE
ncbi:unnamed protein product [Penicillium olsonii]|nr:unnamed protein product [Penicillium olsonii]